MESTWLKLSAIHWKERWEEKQDTNATPHLKSNTGAFLSLQELTCNDSKHTGGKTKENTPGQEEFCPQKASFKGTNIARTEGL